MTLDFIARRLVTEPGVAPAASVAFCVLTADGWRLATGAAGIGSARRPEPVDVETLFDLASVTKPFIACAAARLVSSGVIEWDLPLARVLPGVAETPVGQASLELLLAHRSGLAAHSSLYEPLISGLPIDRGAALRSAAMAQRPDCPPPIPPGGYPPVYSDLGYLLLGEALSEAAGCPLDELVTREVCEPLGIRVASARQWRHRGAAQDRFAPTETVAYRGGEVVGAVHDDNAWAFGADGLCGHAGLFGAASDVARFGAALLDTLQGRLDGWLSAPAARRLTEPRPGGTLRAGFDGRTATGSSAGARFGARSFGHLGFTGTSMWCDPDAQIVAVALTNRVCPTRKATAIRAARPALHDALYQEAERHRRASTKIGPESVRSAPLFENE